MKKLLRSYLKLLKNILIKYFYELRCKYRFKKKKKLVGKLVREEMKCFKILETKGRNYINEN